MPATFELSIKGLDRYLEGMAKIFGDQYLNEAVASELTLVQPEIKAQLESALRKTSETWTGGAASTLFVSPVQTEGNFIFIEFGADPSQDKAAIYKEFGRAKQAAEPFLRPTMKSTWIKNRLRGAMRSMFVKMKIDFGKL
jgi:hypothetical protein